MLSQPEYSPVSYATYHLCLSSRYACRSVSLGYSRWTLITCSSFLMLAVSWLVSHLTVVGLCHSLNLHLPFPSFHSAGRLRSGGEWRAKGE